MEGGGTYYAMSPSNDATRSVDMRFAAGSKRWGVRIDKLVN